jgi:hypothetical protein
MNGPSKVKGGVFFAGSAYALLFVAHIVAAANEWDFVFRSVAVALTAMTFFTGASVVLFGRIERIDQKVKAQRIGFTISLLLSIGLAYAYSNQSFDAVLTALFVTITSITHGIALSRLNSLAKQKVD